MTRSRKGRDLARQNNLDSLRLLFAAMVALYHAAVLSAAPALAPLQQWTSPGIAVDGFFVISGYLIFQSYDKSRSLADYAAKRARRILPAYGVVVVIIGVAGALVTILPIQAYLGPGLFKYLAANLAFLNFLAPTPPGVFLQNPLPAADGALWTIKIEVAFYFSVPLLAWLFRRLPKPAVLSSLYLLSYAYYVALSYAFKRTGHPIYDLLAKQLPGQISFFTAGAAIYYFQPLFMRWRWPLTVLGLLIVIVLPFGLDIGPLYPAVLAMAVMGIAFGPYLGNAGKFGDLSYGLYIWHFPVLQLLVLNGLFRSNPWNALVLGMALSMMMAFLSWHLVEKRFLKRSSHYRQVENSIPAIER
ncbi:MAG TPA: acyltransferase [Rhizomicrobium sp.]|nr:acyltransferase [Rhizomicrobium sp.]